MSADIGFLAEIRASSPAEVGGVVSVVVGHGRGAGVAEDWDAVARAIDARLDELGLRQKELAERADVSTSIIRELRYKTQVRRRSPRTLEALSVGLEWDAGHLARVLTGDAPSVETATEAQRVRESLDALHLRLDVLADRVEGSDRVLRDLVSKVDDLHRALAGDRDVSR